MRIIKYAYIVEDKAQAAFLVRVLPQILDYLNLSKGYTFELDIEYAQKISIYANSESTDINMGKITNDIIADNVEANLMIAGNRKKVEMQMNNAAIESITIFKDDVFFIVQDTDHTIDKVIWEKYHSLVTIIDEKIRPQVRIVLPEQCIEYWLRYLKWYKLNPTEVLTEHFESQKKRAIKNNLYGGSKSREEIVEELCQSINISFLSQYSRSFNWFLMQVKDFLHIIKDK